MGIKKQLLLPQELFGSMEMLQRKENKTINTFQGREQIILAWC